MSFLTIFRQLLGASPPDPNPGLCPWTPLGDFGPPDLWFPLAKIPAGARGDPHIFF